MEGWKECGKVITQEGKVTLLLKHGETQAEDTLENLYYADDIVLPSEKWSHAQQKLERLNNNGQFTGLKINKKTESLRNFVENLSAFKVGDEDVKEVDTSHAHEPQSQLQEVQLRI